MDNVRPRGSYSPIKRSYYTKPTFRPKDLKQDVKTFGVQNMTTAGTRAVVNTGKGKMDTDLKKSRWVWRPKGNYLDHVSKDSGSFMLKKGNPEILLQDHAVVDSGCSSHMTGNKAYLSDYEDFNGGFVAFGSDPKGGLEKQLNHNVKIIRCDNGTEFKNHAMNEFCAKKGIKREFSVARTPQQNGVAERKNRTLIEAARTMLADSLLPIPFWAEAVNTACYVICLDTLPLVKALETYNKRTKRVEENLHINFLEDQSNVTGTGPNWMFDLDFLTNSMNYIPVSVENQVNVDVVEDVPPAAHEKPSESSPKNNDVQATEDAADKEEQHQMKESEQDLQDELEKMVTQELAAKAMDDVSRQALEEEKRRIASQKKATQATSTNILSTDRPSVSTYRPFVSTDRPSVNIASTPTGTNASESSFVYLGGKYLLMHLLFLMLIYPLIQICLTWKMLLILSQMMEYSMEIMMMMKMWVQWLISTTWITLLLSVLFPHSEFIRSSNRQIHRDLHQTVQTRGKSKRLLQPQTSCWVEAMQEELLQFKLQKVWVLVDLPYGKKVINTKWVFRNKRDERSIVVKNKARLIAQGFRQEEGIDYNEVFAPVATIEEISQQPPGFVDLAHPNKVYKAIKALYGLHQAPKAWIETLSSFLMENGYKRGTIDKTLFIKKNKSDIMLVQEYVDDIIFGSIKKSMCTEFEDCMHKRFQMSSMGELTFFLGLQVKQQPKGIFISQDKYVADILKKFDFCSIKTATTPIESNKPLVKDENGVDVYVHVYRSMIGSLMYLTTSRLDIMFAVYACARDSPFELEAFLNSDYGGANLDRKSKTGGCQFLGRRLISWQCKKQTIVANSTTKAEYVSAADCFKNLVYHSRTKNIKIRHHFIRDCYKKILIDVIKIHTDANVADLLTKVSTTFVEQFWMSAKSKIINNVRYITAKVAGKPVTISEASIRSDLLFDDADGIDSMHNQAIFDAIQLMGYEGDLTVLTFNKPVFHLLVVEDFFILWNVTPLFESMLVQPTEDEGEASERQSEPHATPYPPHPKGSGRNHGGHSSSDNIPTRMRIGLTLQRV
ncbi:putative ribonuclease H-like domain-containing protein [Tanacetum coccineum]